MIKRIIFDIDNTLLDTYKDCLKAYDEYLNQRNIDIPGTILYDVMDVYEDLKRDYSVDDISKYLKNNLTIDFSVNDFLELQDLYGNYATLIDDNIPQVLEKLAKDYELVALSKWYCKPQKERLRTANILKYFDEVYGFENAGIKPSQKSFLIAKGNHSVDECLVIGDSIDADILVPKSLGMDTILINYGELSNNDSINKFEEILDVLESKKRGR